MLPSYFEQHDTLEALVASMREFGDLRRWRVTNW